MRIAQITDLHVVTRDRLCYRRVPTNDQVRAHLSYVPNSHGPMALLNGLKAVHRDQIVEQSRRDYQAQCKSEFDRRH